MAHETNPNPEQSNEIYDIYLVRSDETGEVEREKVWTWQDLPTPNGTLGGVIMALNYTTSYVAVPNGEQFDIVRVRNDPFTEVHITPDTVVATIDAPGEDDPQLPDILQDYKNNTNYEYVQV